MSTKEGLELLRRKYTKDNGWRYGGGARVREYIHGIHEYQIVETIHSRYYENYIRPQWIKKGTPADYIPNHKKKCICEHDINENCFIYRIRPDNRIDVRIIGNSCIKKFDLEGRHCQLCDSVHQNRKDKYCNNCRTEIKKQEKLKTHCKCGRKKKQISHGLCKKCWSSPYY